MLELLKPDFQFEDDRGKLIQLIHEGYEQVNVLVSRKGAFRGEHFHRISSEAFYVVCGSVELIAERDGIKMSSLFHEGDFFRIEPLVKHSLTFPENCTLVALYDKCIESQDGTKDIYSET
jgi:quercetin dioxygenase-like cupin family protein